ncbi:MAG TPA: PhzF family phenazine biosynthesis protein [Symbiobacteriaceae bacterium]|jgi:trans-2,3-dihydro-3-hydroxyanthranilate isomerase
MLVMPYSWLDVFAPEPFCGNQLCVFGGADDLPLPLMKKVARELNHSETTFLQRSEVPGADFRIRILLPTPGPAAEIPFAGHPILGSACVVAGAGKHPSTVSFETGIGVIPVTVTPLAEEGVWDARMVQPVPQVVRTAGRSPELAGALGLALADIRDDLPLEAVDNGMQTVLIPLTSLEAVRRARPDMARLRAVLGPDGRCTLIFAPGGVEPGSHVHCRVFSPFDLVPEDPATGSANGPLGEYLVRHGVVPGPFVRSEQGYSVGRPSRILIEVERAGGETTAVFVSGRVYMLGKGEFRLTNLT